MNKYYIIAKCSQMYGHYLMHSSDHYIDFIRVRALSTRATLIRACFNLRFRSLIIDRLYQPRGNNKLYKLNLRLTANFRT